MRDKILSFENVSFSYHTKQGELLALNNLNFDIYDGEFVSVVGPSGCGKTTILSLISGLLKPSSGKIVFHNKQKSKIGYMFQKDHLFEWRSIWKNVRLGLELSKKAKEQSEISYANELLEKYGLSDFKNSHPSQLSGGMRQRVALIRTLVLRPDLLLLDEPFSALDFQNRLKVCDDVYSIICQEKKTSILVTHDISEAVSVSDRVIVLSRRPATVQKIVEIQMKDIETPFKRRESGDFAGYFNTIWKELNDEKT